MRDAVLFLVAVLIVAGGYGYTKNPKACQKLGADVTRDVKSIYLPSESAAPASDETLAADSSTNAPPAPAPAPAPPPPQHFPMGYVAPVTTPPPAPASDTDSSH